MMITRRQFVGGVAAAGVAAAVQWQGVGRAGAASPSWLTCRGSNARTGMVKGESELTPSTIARLRRRWTKGPPTVADTETLARGTRLYSVTTGTDGRAVLSRLKSSDGSAVWRRTVEFFANTPSVDDGRIVIYSQRPRENDNQPIISAFDFDSGAPLWSVVAPHDEEAPMMGGVGFANGKVVAATGLRLSVLRASDGAALRSISVTGDWDSDGRASPMIDGNGTAWYAFKYLDTLPVPPSTVDPITNSRHVGNRATTPVLAGDRVIVAAAYEINTFDVRTGAKTLLTSFPFSTHHSLAWDGTRIFAASRRTGNANALRAYNAASGAVIWERPGAVTAPIEVNGMVIVGEDTGGLAVYRASNGQELARFPGTARGADPIVSNGQLLAGFSAAAVPAGQTAPLSRFTL